MNLYFGHTDEAHEVLGETTAHNNDSSVPYIIIGVLAIVLLATVIVYFVVKKSKQSPAVGSPETDTN